MELTAVFVTLTIGAIAGWLVGPLVEGARLGLFGNIIVGIAGASMVALFFQRWRVSWTLGSTLVAALTSAIGAVVLLLIFNLVLHQFSG